MTPQPQPQAPRQPERTEMSPDDLRRILDGLRSREWPIVRHSLQWADDARTPIFDQLRIHASATLLDALAAVPGFEPLAESLPIINLAEDAHVLGYLTTTSITTITTTTSTTEEGPIS